MKDRCFMRNLFEALPGVNTELALQSVGHLNHWALTDPHRPLPSPLRHTHLQHWPRADPHSAQTLPQLRNQWHLIHPDPPSPSSPSYPPPSSSSSSSSPLPHAHTNTRTPVLHAYPDGRTPATSTELARRGGGWRKEKNKYEYADAWETVCWRRGGMERREEGDMEEEESADGGGGVGGRVSRLFLSCWRVVFSTGILTKIKIKSKNYQNQIKIKHISL